MPESAIKSLLARQGIYDANSIVCAYELLYRNGGLTTAEVNNNILSEGDAATSSVLTQLFTNLDIGNIIGNKRAFINFTYNNILQKVPLMLPKNRIVIEVLETVNADKEIVANLIEFKNKDYQIALDDFVYNKEFEPLIEIADVIKIDVLNQNEQQIIDQLAPLKHFKGKLLAEKIEDKDQFKICQQLGFHYFQGFFLNIPDSVQGKVLTENKTQLMRLLTELNDEDADIERIEEIILQIPKLSYRILRLANSASMYTSKKIDSLLDAITQLGLVQVRNWMNLLLLSSLDDVAPDLLERTLIRAKMCESLAQSVGYSNPHQAYTVGLLSTLDGILNEPLNLLLSKIQLSESINEALIDKKGELGAILKYSMDYEHANFQHLNVFPLDEAELTRHYLQGIEYANSIIDIINK